MQYNVEQDHSHVKAIKKLCFILYMLLVKNQNKFDKKLNEKQNKLQGGRFFSSGFGTLQRKFNGYRMFSLSPVEVQKMLFLFKNLQFFHIFTGFILLPSSVQILIHIRKKTIHIFHQPKNSRFTQFQTKLKAFKEQIRFQNDRAILLFSKIRPMVTLNCKQA